jgi:hypothetical protein
MRFGTWNVRSLYRVDAIKSVVGELEKYKFDLVGVQEVRWEGEGYQTADNWGRGVYSVLVGKPEGKRPLGRPRHRWEDDIKMDLRETGISGANWIQLAQDRVHWWAFVNTVMNLRVP